MVSLFNDLLLHYSIRLDERLEMSADDSPLPNVHNDNVPLNAVFDCNGVDFSWSLSECCFNIEGKTAGSRGLMYGAHMTSELIKLFLLEYPLLDEAQRCPL